MLVGGVARLLSLPLFALTFLISNTPLMLVTFTLAAMCLVAAERDEAAARADVLHAVCAARGHGDGRRAPERLTTIAPTLVGVLAGCTACRPRSSCSSH